MTSASRRHKIKLSATEPISTHLGPFYDLNGTEILPVLTEATQAATERVMGRYQIRSNIPSLDGGTLVIDSRLVTCCLKRKEGTGISWSQRPA